MISLSAPTFDIDGHINLRELPSTDLGETRRRISRQKTLDGGVTVVDSGYAVGDKTLDVRWRIRSESEYLAVDRLVRLYPRLTASTRDGIYTVAPERVKRTGAEGELMLMVVS